MKLKTRPWKVKAVFLGMCKERLGLEGFWKHRSWVAVYFTDYKFGSIRRRRFKYLHSSAVHTTQTEVSVNLLPNTKMRVINIATLSDHWINRVEQKPFKCEKVDPGRQTFCDAPKIFCALMTWQQGGILSNSLFDICLQVQMEMALIYFIIWLMWWAVIGTA